MADAERREHDRQWRAGNADPPGRPMLPDVRRCSWCHGALPSGLVHLRVWGQCAVIKAMLPGSLRVGESLEMGERITVEFATTEGLTVETFRAHWRGGRDWVDPTAGEERIGG